MSDRRLLRLFAATAALGGLLLASAPARAADLCLQFNGVSCPLSGDLGFFRFMAAKLPTSIKKATRLHGRSCGVGAVTGTAVMIPNSGDLVTLNATFECDALNGNIKAQFDVTDGVVVGTTGAGEASYGNFVYQDYCDVAVVDCATEPGL